MTTATYDVTGMTCGHCVGAVTSEITSVNGVESVEVELNPSGVSKVTVTSAGPLSDDAIAAALDEAGNYHLASRS